MTIASPRFTIASPSRRRLDPRWLIVGHGLAALILSSIRSPVGLLWAMIGLLGWLTISRLRSQVVRQRVAAFILFLLPFVLVAALSPTLESQPVALRLVLRASVLFLLAGSFVASMTLADLAAGLASLGMPRLFSHLLVIAYRFVEVIRSEVRRMQTALRVRGFRRRPMHRAWKSSGQLMAALMLRTEDRALRVAQAMRCRGFQGRVRPLRRFRTRWTDLLVFGYLLGVALIAWFLDEIGRHLGVGN
jgi:cobalt/nickel transport system permease protein